MMAPDEFTLRADEVSVWHARLDPGETLGQSFRATLSEDELERASRFVFERDRHRFEVARCTLRILLGRYLGLPPVAIRFRYTAFGKPFLEPAQNAAAVSFNLSHSGEKVGLAFSRGRDLGIDLEEIQPEPDGESLARLSFSAREQAEFRHLPPEQKAQAFFLCWTRKEAFVKALGDGLSLPLDSFDVSLTPHEPALLRAVRGDLRPSFWHLVNLDVGPGYAAALVGSGAPFTIRNFVYRELL